MKVAGCGLKVEPGALNVEPVLGSWLSVLGSRLLLLGSWFAVLGSWFLVLGSQFAVLGSWFLVPGSWFAVLGSWFWFSVLSSQTARQDRCGTHDPLSGSLCFSWRWRDAPGCRCRGLVARSPRLNHYRLFPRPTRLPSRQRQLWRNPRRKRRPPLKQRQLRRNPRRKRRPPLKQRRSQRNPRRQPPNLSQWTPSRPHLRRWRPT